LVEKVLELDEPGRTVVILRYFDGLSGPEIAARLGIQPGAVRMRLKRALDQLRRELGDDPRAREAWGLLVAPFAAAGPPGAPALDGAAAGPGFPVAAGLLPLIAKAAFVVTCLGAGCLVGSRLAERPPAPGVSAAITHAPADREARILELEDELEAARKELERGATWKLDLERRLCSTQEAVAQLSMRLAALEDPLLDPA
jgi:hypothetical protein